MDKIFSIKGRSGRKEFWLISITVFILFMVAGGLQTEAGFSKEVNILIGLAAVVISLLFNVPVQIRRWHDRNKSAWFLLVNLIPLIGFIWIVIELGCLPGTSGQNRYGPSNS